MSYRGCVPGEYPPPWWGLPAEGMSVTLSQMSTREEEQEYQVYCMTWPTKVSSQALRYGSGQCGNEECRRVDLSMSIEKRSFDIVVTQRGEVEAVRHRVERKQAFWQ